MSGTTITWNRTLDENLLAMLDSKTMTEIKRSHSHQLAEAHRKLRKELEEIFKEIEAKQLKLATMKISDKEEYLNALSDNSIEQSLDIFCGILSTTLSTGEDMVQEAQNNVLREIKTAEICFKLLEQATVSRSRKIEHLTVRVEKLERLAGGIDKAVLEKHIAAIKHQLNADFEPFNNYYRAIGKLQQQMAQVYVMKPNKLSD